MAVKRKSKVANNVSFVAVNNAERKAVVRGITKWALSVKALSVVLAPVDISNLRGSAYIAVQGGQESTGGTFIGNAASAMGSQHAAVVNASMAKSAAMTNKTRVVGVVGFSAVYAASVHENPRSGKTGGILPTEHSRHEKTGKPINYQRKTWATTGEWKYLSKPLAEFRKKGLEILAKEIRRGING